MRPVYFYGAMTLDGYLATDEDDLQWLFDVPLEGLSTYPEFEAKIDTIVMGRVTYDKTTALLAGAPFYPGKEKIIFSRSRHDFLEEDYFVKGNPVNVLKALQQKPGKGIWIVGGGELVTTLLEHDIISEMWVQIAPVLLGRGKALFPKGNYQNKLELLDMTQMGQLAELHFRCLRN